MAYLHHDYSESWEEYYKYLFENFDRIPWDDIPKEYHGLFQDTSLFEHKDIIIDVGCGTGKLTSWLINHFQHVIGLDCPHKAIERARLNHAQGGINFQRVDVFNKNEVKNLKYLFSRANVHVRGVLHQIHPNDRMMFLENTISLIGVGDSIIICELNTNIIKSIRQQLHRKSLSVSSFDFLSKHGASGLYGFDENDIFLMSNYGLKLKHKQDLLTEVKLANDSSGFSLPSTLWVFEK